MIIFPIIFQETGVEESSMKNPSTSVLFFPCPPGA